MSIKKFSTIIMLLTTISACFYKHHKTYDGFVFGTYYKITLDSNKSILPEIEDVFENVNNKMSVFTKDSEINKLNNTTQIEASEELLQVLLASDKVYKESNKAFDVSVGELIELWGFGKKRERKTPTDAKIAEVLSYSGFDKISIKGNIVTKADKRLQINLSAIAKGYAVDKIAELLDSKNIDNYLIDIGGEIKAKGNKNGKLWKIGLANPIKPEENKMVFNLDNMAVATSGDYQNFHIQNGVKYSHTISSKTGKPVLSNLVSVSVFNKSCMMADAYATAIMAMGFEKGLKFAKKYNLNVILIKNDGNVTKIN